MASKPLVCFSSVCAVLGPSAGSRDLILSRSVLGVGSAHVSLKAMLSCPSSALCSLLVCCCPRASPSHHLLPIHCLVEHLPIYSAKVNKQVPTSEGCDIPFLGCFWASVFSASEDVMCSINPCLSLCLRKINVAQIYACSHSWGKMKQWYT